jgi:DNA-3-methyladenine glycosylase II
MTPKKWQQALSTLSRQDPVLKKLIRAHGTGRLQRRRDPFVALSRSIIGQQLSVKAAQSIWLRLVDMAGAIEPETIAASEIRQLRGCGLSANKSVYLTELAVQFRDGRIDTAGWRRLDDDQVIAELTRLKGIGRWTAEMFLIFHMQRPNVLPLDDAGLQRAMRLHYGNGRALAKPEIRDIAQRWQPWCSVATWFMWRSLDADPVALGAKRG